MSLAKAYAGAFGVVYSLVGVIGFAMAPTLATGTLILFPVNAVHDAVHLLFGLAGVAALLTGRQVLYARVAAVLFAVLTVAGSCPSRCSGSCHWAARTSSSTV